MMIYTKPVSAQKKQHCSTDTRSEDKPVDLVHLSRQSLGDRDLELEILALFKNQSKLFVDRLKVAKTKSERKMAAHTILGSARGIGAWKVADCASIVELDGTNSENIDDLSDAVDRANGYISTLLDE